MPRKAVASVDNEAELYSDLSDRLADLAGSPSGEVSNIWPEEIEVRYCHGVTKSRQDIKASSFAK